MYKLRITIYTLDNNGYNFVVKTMNTTKSILGLHSKWYKNMNLCLAEELNDRLVKCCRESIRDELIREYGKCWRKYEKPDQIVKSTLSAIKRARHY